MTRRPRTRGQALVEFAMVVPLFLAMLFAIVDVGRVIWASNTLANAAREAARFAIVHGALNGDCPVGPYGGASPATIPAPTSGCPYPSPSVEGVKGVARGFAVAGGPVTVTVCYGQGCTGDVSTRTNARGQPVTVVVQSRITLFTGALLGLGGFDVQGSSTMLVNH